MAFEVLDEHEQGEVVRKWLRANVMSIAIGIGIGLALIFGWQQWKSREQRTQAEAAMQYEAFAKAVQEDRADDAATIGAALRKDYAKSPYAVFTALRQAEEAVGNGDLKAAEGHLAWASDAASAPALKSVIALRRARVAYADGNAEAALTFADSVAKEDFTAMTSELRGDALLKLGRHADARAAYEQALGALDAQAPGRDVVQMKLIDLPAASEKQNS